MPVFTDKKTGGIYIQFDYQGKTYKKRMPHGTGKREARNYESDWRNALSKPQINTEEKLNITFKQFLIEYYLPYSESNKASFDRDVEICKIALGFYENMYLRSIKPINIEEFKQARMKTKTQHGTPRKPATIQRELSVISKIFSLAFENGFVDINPCLRVKKIKFDNTCTRKLGEEDEEKFFAAFESDWAHNVCLFILHTGLRQGDALALQPHHIDWKNEQITIVQGKTQRLVTIPMTQTVRSILRKWLDKYDSKYVFPSPKTGMRGTSVKKVIEGACRRAKISRLTVRDLRRTAATRLLERGANHLAIAKFLGHSDTRILNVMHNRSKL